jgi:peptide/nickel transport system permease protein
MVALIANRLVLSVATLWIVSVLVFVGTEILPGDVAASILGQGVTEEAKEAIRSQLGLNRPAAIRYVEWLGNIIQGDLGYSLAARRPIADMLRPRLVNTLTLAALAAAISVPLSIGIGLLAAAHPNGIFDRLTSYVSMFLISFPEFLVAAALVLLFSVTWRLFPSMTLSIPTGNVLQLLRSLALPVMTLAAAMLAHMSRMTRAAVLEVMRSPYIEMAVLKGVRRRRIILRHAFPNAIGPIASVVALNLSYLIGGVVIVETMFTFPGLGRLMVDAIASRDVPVAQITILIFCAAYVLFNLLADIATTMSNPKLRSAHWAR